MVKYMPKEQPKFKPEDNKENEKRSDVPAQRPISARDRPFDAYVAAKEARDHRYLVLLKSVISPPEILALHIRFSFELFFRQASVL